MEKGNTEGKGPVALHCQNHKHPSLLLAQAPSLHFLQLYPDNPQFESSKYPRTCKQNRI